MCIRDRTEADAKKLLASLPAGLSAERREIIETACQLVGKGACRNVTAYTA